MFLITSRHLLKLSVCLLLFNLYHQIVAIFKNFVANLSFYDHPKIFNRVKIRRLCWSRHNVNLVFIKPRFHCVRSIQIFICLYIYIFIFLYFYIFIFLYLYFYIFLFFYISIFLYFYFFIFLYLYFYIFFILIYLY